MSDYLSGFDTSGKNFLTMLEFTNKVLLTTYFTSSITEKDKREPRNLEAFLSMAKFYAKSRYDESTFQFDSQSILSIPFLDKTWNANGQGTVNDTAMNVNALGVEELAEFLNAYDFPLDKLAFITKAGYALKLVPGKLQENLQTTFREIIKDSKALGTIITLFVLLHVFAPVVASILDLVLTAMAGEKAILGLIKFLSIVKSSDDISELDSAASFFAQFVEAIAELAQPALMLWIARIFKRLFIRAKNTNSSILSREEAISLVEQDMLETVPDYVADSIIGGTKSIAWRPSMTLAEAAEYTKDSSYSGKIFYHGTDTAGAQSVSTDGIAPELFNPESTYGPGFYLGKSETIARDYGSGAVLSIMIKANNPKKFRDGVDFLEAAEDYVSANQIDTLDPVIDFTNFLRSQGYDAIEIENLGYYVVYEPQQIVVFKTEINR
jgi:hypothetical protein